MFIKFFNRFIAAVLVPLFMAPCSPVFLIMKHFNEPFDLIPLSESAVIDTSEVYLTAHRGVTAVAPENTIPAYEKAVELGYYSAECDIRLTKDNVWVLSHNDYINRRMWQVGKISETDYDELVTYKYKNGSNFWQEGLKMPTLDEFLDVFVGSSTRPQIEIKTKNYDMLDTVIDAVKAKGLEKSAIIISFDLEQLKVLRSLDKDIELWYLVYRITQDNIDEAKSVGGNVWLSADFAVNDSDSINLAAESGVDVSFWTVNKLEDAEKLYNLGVRYIETDILCK
ncbi:MAG: glycerophosphodiester phosphodiesterase [Acutalibacteraceae bacterium]